MGWLSDKLFGKRKKLDINKIAGYMDPAQQLVGQQVDLAGQFTDFDSLMNRQFRNWQSKNVLNQGQQIGSNISRLAAQTGVSPAIAMMQSRMGMNQAMGQGSNSLYGMMMDNMKYGGNLLSSATGAQTGLSENLANAYVGNINAHNQRRNQRMGTAMGLLGMGLDFGSNFIPST